jgi:hypothetical protein
MSQALRLIDTSSQYVHRVAAAFDYNAAYTATGWVYLVSDTNDYGNIFTVHQTTVGASSDHLGHAVDGVTPELYVEAIGGTGSSDLTGTALGVGVWRYVSIIRSSSSQLDEYNDGSASPDLSVTQSTALRVTASDRLVMGAWWDGAAYVDFTDVRLAYWRIWTSALSNAEILAEKASATAVKASPWADYPLQANVDDVSGNARHLTFVGGAPTYEAGPFAFPFAALLGD